MKGLHSDRLDGLLTEDRRRLKTELRQWLFLFWFGSIVIYACFFLLVKLSSK